MAQFAARVSDCSVLSLRESSVSHNPGIVHEVQQVINQRLIDRIEIQCGDRLSGSIKLVQKETHVDTVGKLLTTSSDYINTSLVQFVIIPHEFRTYRLIVPFGKCVWLVVQVNAIPTFVSRNRGIVGEDGANLRKDLRVVSFSAKRSVTIESVDADTCRVKHFQCTPQRRDIHQNGFELWAVFVFESVKHLQKDVLNIVALAKGSEFLQT